MATTIQKAGKLVDELGKIRAKKAELEKQEEALKASLIQLGIDEADGRLFHATVSHCEFKVIDYRGLIEKLHPRQKVVEAFTRTQERVQVRVSAR